ncbi:MAG: hypothetical protein GX366_03670 [Epulopiscium sp.]|nr:hypothetical protein [Candidatus Epulonipiscium sp.]
MKVISIGPGAEGVLAISTNLGAAGITIHVVAQAIVIVTVKAEYTNMAKKGLIGTFSY